MLYIYIYIYIYIDKSINALIMDHGKLIQSKHLASTELILLVDIARIVLSLYPLKRSCLTPTQCLYVYQFRSTNSPHSCLSKYYVYQKDKRAETGKPSNKAVLLRRGKKKLFCNTEKCPNANSFVACHTDHISHHFIAYLGYSYGEVLSLF